MCFYDFICVLGGCEFILIVISVVGFLMVYVGIWDVVGGKVFVVIEVGFLG